ncbi:MAG: TIGR03546 family protein, partial [Planctomycetales bacterium]|nr:TIGR03546 family protein [Planctomycetales bacterium]
MGMAINSLLRTTSSRHQPRQVALAIALGVLCGLLPKASLLFVTLACSCYCLPIHLPLAVVTCLATSLAVPSLEPSVGRLGLWSLSHPQLSQFWLRLDASPLVPWLRLHNTVMHGSLLLGLALLPPIYLITLPLARRLSLLDDQRLTSFDPHFASEVKPQVASRREETLAAPVAPLISYSPIDELWAGQAQDEVPLGEGKREPLPASAVARLTKKCAVEKYPAANSFAEADPIEKITAGAGCPVNSETRDSSFAASVAASVEQLEMLLEDCRSERSAALDSGQIAHRASQLADLVGDLLATCDAPADRPAEFPAEFPAEPACTPLVAEGNCSPQKLELPRSELPRSELPRPAEASYDLPPAAEEPAALVSGPAPSPPPDGGRHVGGGGLRGPHDGQAGGPYGA